MIHFNHKLFILGVLLCLVGKTGWGQLQVEQDKTAQQLAEMLVGNGVTVLNPSITGSSMANGFFFNGETTNLGIDSGVVISSGKVVNIPGPVNTGLSTGFNLPGDIDLSTWSGKTTADAFVLEFDFIPSYDEINLTYTFGSSEYQSVAWYTGDYNDIFAYFVSGPRPNSSIPYNRENIALIPNTEIPVSVFNVNPDVNNEYYRGNSGNTIAFYGLTVVFTASLPVVPCEQYHIKIALSDAGGSPPNGDDVYDSGVFLKAGSFSSPGIALEPLYTTPGGEPFAVEGCTQADLRVTLPFANPVTSWVVFDSITGTATNGVDYNFLNDSVMFLPNQVSVTIPIVPVFDGLPEGDENIFIYLSNQVGCAGTNLLRTEIVLHNFTPVEIGSNMAVCEGTQVTFDAGEGYKSYTWHDGSHGDTWTSTGTPSVTQVSVNIIDNYGCPSSDALQLTTHPQPVQNPIKHE